MLLSSSSPTNVSSSNSLSPKPVLSTDSCKDMEKVHFVQVDKSDKSSDCAIVDDINILAGKKSKEQKKRKQQSPSMSKLARIKVDNTFAKDVSEDEW